MKPEAIIEEVKKARSPGPGRRRVSDGREMGIMPEGTRRIGNMSSATPTKETREPTWIEASWKGNPHSVLEGMIIGAYAIGAHEGYIYVRNEYPLAVQNRDCHSDRRKRKGFLGRHILGSGFRLRR